MPAYEQAVGIVRPGGVISRVGVPQYEEAPIGFGSLFGRNITPHRRTRARPRLHRANCCPTSSTAPSSPAGSSTAPSLWTASRRLPGHGRPEGAEGAGATLISLAGKLACHRTGNVTGYRRIPTSTGPRLISAEANTPPGGKSE